MASRTSTSIRSIQPSSALSGGTSLYISLKTLHANTHGWFLSCATISRACATRLDLNPGESVSQFVAGTSLHTSIPFSSQMS